MVDEDSGLELLVTNAVASIRFRRPDRANAYKPSWSPRITDFVRSLDTNDEVRCVLVSGEGRNFQAGGDLEALDFGDSTPLEERQNRFAEAIATWNELISAIRESRKPFVASVQGACAGGGLGLVAACDLVIAAEDATFILAQPRNGFSIDSTTTYFLPRQIGLKKAMEWALLGPSIKASEAARLGLVNFTVPAELLPEETEKLVDRLAQGPTRAIGLNKMLINRSLENEFAEQADLECLTYRESAATEDFQEGLRAFMERRPPKFHGR